MKKAILPSSSREPPLSTRLGDAEWLEGGFTAGDLMMVAVLFRSKGSGILDEYPNLCAYVAQLAVFTGGQPQR
jgi:glutathione S-transferase